MLCPQDRTRVIETEWQLTALEHLWGGDTRLEVCENYIIHTRRSCDIYGAPVHTMQYCSMYMHQIMLEILPIMLFFYGQVNI